jgi:response regulator RpfG family c-di-GMP phosphodiesterase
MMGFALGAVDYVAKPINAAVLMARVRTHVALANQREALEEQVRLRTAQLEEAHADLIACLGRAMECHESAAVGNRFQRMAQYARLIALAACAKRASFRRRTGIACAGTRSTAPPSSASTRSRI